jgi:hypothetical protein
VGFQVDKYQRRWCREGAETRGWSQMCSLRLAVADGYSKPSRIRRFSNSQPPSAGAGASSAWTCANVCARLTLELYIIVHMNSPVSVDELVDPDLELPLPAVIRPLCRRDARFLFYFSNDSSMSTWIPTMIGAWSAGGRRRRGSVPARGIARQMA